MSVRSHPLDLLLRELLLHRDLDSADRRAVLDLPVRLRLLDPHSYLVREGAVPGKCSVLVDGFAFRQKVTGDGSRQIMAVCIPGDAVDLQNIFLDLADHNVQMLTRGTVADIDRDQLQALVLERPAIGAAVIQMTLVEASILREWVVNVGRRETRERVAHLLCEFAVRLETRGLIRSGGFELPMISRLFSKNRAPFRPPAILTLIRDALAIGSYASAANRVFFRRTRSVDWLAISGAARSKVVSSRPALRFRPDGASLASVHAKVLQPRNLPGPRGAA